MLIKGINTHNLKNLDFSMTQPEIICICGVSGSGKSSLAYHTIHKLCSDAFSALENGFLDDNEYIVKDYEKLLPSIAIKQLNLNSNPKSTIYSYLNFSSLLSSLKEIEYKRLKLNKPEHECCSCHGKGTSMELDLELLINFNEKIESIPFLPWKIKEYKNNLYEKLFHEFCDFYSIDKKLTFNGLSKKEQDLLLYYKGDIHFKINFKHNNKSRVRNLCYTGIISFLEKFLYSEKKSESLYAQKYCKSLLCQKCNGSKINTDLYKDINIGLITFQDFLTLSIDEILESGCLNHKRFEKIKRLFISISNLGIGYLNLSRSIPTLSGGEIQKLNFANLLHSKISGILIVIDEISSGLHVTDFPKILQYITDLKNENNYIILVEHNPFFLNNTDRLICMGPEGGKNGGYIIAYDTDANYIKNDFKKIKTENFIELKDITINNIAKQDARILRNAITAIVGKSGSGKTSLAKYIESNLKHTIYISQNALHGNSRSTIASYLEINKTLANLFAKQYGLSYRDFMPNLVNEIVCKDCSGTGIIKYERSFETSLITTCPSCDGKLFNKNAELYKINNLSIKDIYDMEIESLDIIDSNKIKKLSFFSKKLYLGYITLNRKINTLSGGEIKRIKLLKSLICNELKNKILIIDEPSAGLDAKIYNNILTILHDLKQQTESIVIIDHNPLFFLESDYIIEIGPGSGYFGGKIIFNNYTSLYCKDPKNNYLFNYIETIKTKH